MSSTLFSSHHFLQFRPRLYFFLTLSRSYCFCCLILISKMSSYDLAFYCSPFTYLHHSCFPGTHCSLSFHRIYLTLTFVLCLFFSLNQFLFTSYLPPSVCFIPVLSLSLPLIPFAFYQNVRRRSFHPYSYPRSISSSASLPLIVYVSSSFSSVSCLALSVHETCGVFLHVECVYFKI